MADFKDVPTDELLTFQEFTPVHEPFSNAKLSVDNLSQDNFVNSQPENDNKSQDFTEGNIDKGM